MSQPRPTRPSSDRGPAAAGSRRTAHTPGRRSGASPPPAAGRRRRTVIIGTVVIVALIVLLAGHTNGAGSARGPLGPEGIPLEVGPLLAPASTSATGGTIDGVQCDTSEQVAYHVHTHLAVYVNGQARALPAGVGIVEPVAQPTAAGPFDEASRCYYWLHVHARDGVIHIESPTTAIYTLGQFFDIWGQPLGADQVGPDTGELTIYVDGKRFHGDPRSIVLGSHVDIQIDVGTPAPPPTTVDWSGSGL